MRNIPLSISYCLLIIGNIFNLWSNFTFAEETPMAIATPSVTPTPQSVITREATDITSSSATLNAIVPFGMTAVSIYFEYSTTSGAYTDSVDAERDGMSDNVSARITGLSAATTYYYRIVAVTKPVPPFNTGYTYGNEESFPTLSATPTVTPTPVCKAESIDASPKTLKLKREESGDITITVTCTDGSPVVGELVAAKIMYGKQRISISPQSADTGVDGQAIFTITATEKTGNAKVKFKAASGLKTTVTVKVNKE